MYRLTCAASRAAASRVSSSRSASSCLPIDRSALFFVASSSRASASVKCDEEPEWDIEPPARDADPPARDPVLGFELGAVRHDDEPARVIEPPVRDPALAGPAPLEPARGIEIEAPARDPERVAEPSTGPLEPSPLALM